ncbi:NAD-dependent epimerase/dehydratase family protein [Natronorubrum aibiense]|uniref:NAD-dependent epimerase/dehydratase family protein n=1 Tax=Natronorubrum aibiense TaxID=348826 RepID=A0A5P9PA61_9EURY|nr:NAD-dependent epimerase/dehydratase family protein [Natronorubrum aibiense]QFU85031.1 NAD-dependent epimerase/dehydratase family protein [Natronorubrum aibiense]
MTGQTAAVTGATGFLGTRLCDLLLEAGWDVRGLSRPTSDRGDLEGVDWHVGDLFDDETLRALVDGADVVFHLAGVSLWNATPEQVHRVNVDGTENVLEACRDVDAGRLVFTSTAGTRRPPDDRLVADETDVAEPVGAYQSSKARAERLVDQYAETDGEAVTVHPTSIFGPGDEAFTAQLLSMGVDPTMPAHLPGGLSIVGVSDVVDGIVAAAEHGVNGEHYLLGGENLTYNQAVSRIANAVDGSPARIRVPATAIHAAGPVAEVASSVAGIRMFPFDRQMAQLATKRLFYSSSKASEELGYDYRPLEAHLPETMAWYRSEC